MSVSGMGKCYVAVNFMKYIFSLLLITSLLAGCKDEIKDEPKEEDPLEQPDSSINTITGDFTLVVIPDPQYYTHPYNGGTMDMFMDEVNWINTNKADIAYVACVGDISDRGDAYTSDWTNAWSAMNVLHSNNIPYGVAVGNHDQKPASGTSHEGYPLLCPSTLYNSTFGYAKFAGIKSWYGGHYSTDNGSHYDTFTAGGYNFIVIYLEYSTDNAYSTLINTWAYNLILNNPSKKAIIVTHHAIYENGDIKNSFSAQGSAIYESLKTLPNFFMMLSGHVECEGYRQKIPEVGRTVRIFLQDYQFRTNGGNGMMRLFNFSPANNTISVKTYSPHLGTYETDGNSQFTVPMFADHQTITLEDFNSNVGRFDQPPTFSPLTVGISTTSTLAYCPNTTSEPSKYGEGCLKAVLNDDTSSSSAWKVRLNSGGGNPVYGPWIPEENKMYFWLKTSMAGGTVRVWVDDDAGTDQTAIQYVISDGEWHIYAFPMTGLSAAPGTAGTGGGGITGFNYTLDAIVLERPKTSSTWTVYVDNITYF